MIKLLKNILKLSFFIIFIFSSILFISSCETYRPEPLAYKGSIVEPFRERGVHISAKLYDAEESKAYLDRDLLRVGFRPIQITIQNNTPHVYALSTKSTPEGFTEGRQIAKYVTLSAVPRAIALKVASIFFWPFMIPSAFDTILTFKAHQKMKKDYHAKSVKETEEWILPYSTVHRVLFLASKEPIENFPLLLKEQQTKQHHSFSVKIKK